MRRLVLSDQAISDLADIDDYIDRESGSPSIADRFVDEIEKRCSKLAALPGTLGVARPELHPGLRSVPHKAYVIFFIYNDDTLNIVTILHGMRDIDAIFDPDGITD